MGVNRPDFGWILRGSALLLALGIAGPVAASPASTADPTPAFNLDDPASLPLANVDGASSTQSRFGGGINSLCGRMLVQGITLTGDAAVNDLFNRCTSLVDTSLALTNFVQLADLDTGLSAEELVQAILEVIGDESGSFGTAALQTGYVQASNITARLAALRQGATGINIAGLSMNGIRPQDPAMAALWDDSAAGSDSDLPARVGVFLNGDVNWGDFDGHGDEVAYDFDGWGITAGADYRFTDNLVAGIAFGFTESDDDFRGGSELRKDAATVSLYGTWGMGGLYVDALASYSYNDIELDRKIRFGGINRTADGQTRAHEFNGSLGVGYMFQFGGLSIGPRARLDYARVDVRGFTEEDAGGLNLNYDDQDIRSFITVVGAEASYAISTGFGVLLPSVRIDWQHEYDNDGRVIGAHYDADPNKFPLDLRIAQPDRDFGTYGVGLAATFPHQITAFIDFESIFGLRDIDSYSVTGGLRVDF